MRIFNANTRGITDRRNLRQIIDHTLSKRAVISVLTETKSREADFFRIRKQFNQFQDKISVFSDTNEEGARSAGVILAIRSGSLENTYEVKKSGRGKYIILAGKIEGFDYLIIAVYGDSGDDMQTERDFIDMENDIREVHGRHPCQHIVMAGDFNCVLHAADTLSNRRKPRSENKLNQIIVNLNIIDLWNEVCPESAGYTFGVTFSDGHEIVRSYASRLDRIYASPNTLFHPKINREEFIRVHADHLAVSSDLKSADTDPPTYRFPDRLLKSSNFLEYLHTSIREFLVTQSSEAEQYYESISNDNIPPPCGGSHGRCRNEWNRNSTSLHHKQ